MSLRSRQRGALRENVILSALSDHRDARQTYAIGQLKMQQPVMSEMPKVKGPASYFPSIEKTYGEPTSRWVGILKQANATGE